MKALAIIGAIVSAWISGVVLGNSEEPRAVNGAAVLFVIAVVFGIAAWWSK